MLPGFDVSSSFPVTTDVNASVVPILAMYSRRSQTASLYSVVFNCRSSSCFNEAAAAPSSTAASPGLRSPFAIRDANSKLTIKDKNV